LLTEGLKKIKHLNKLTLWADRAQRKLIRHVNITVSQCVRKEGCE